MDNDFVLKIDEPQPAFAANSGEDAPDSDVAPVEEPVSVEEPVAEPVAEPAEEPVAEPAEEPAEESQTEAPAEEQTEAPAEAPGPDYLDMTIQSCIQPLEMRFSQINGTYHKFPKAYRSFTYINSVIEGVIPPEKYSYAADETDRGVKMSKWNIAEAIRAIRAFEAADRRVDFVSARVSPQLVREPDFYGYIKGILEENNFDEPSKLCLEFPRSIVYEDEEQARMALLALKLLKVRSMMAGCGEKDNPLMLLMTLPFDYVILAPWLTYYTGDRGKSAAMEAFLTFLRNIGCEVIADGVRGDNQLQLLARVDCYGYIPSAAYKGEVEHGKLRMPLEEALQQKEDDY